MSSNQPPNGLNGTEQREEIHLKEPEPANEENSSQDDSAPASSKPAKRGIMARLGLDVQTILTMIKGAIAPTIGITIYQSDAVAGYFTTLGYVVSIISVLSLSILPRGKFIQTMILNVLFVGLGAAMALLILWTSLQARLHTQSAPTAPSASMPPYNSSQAAVSGLWLFFIIWLVNTIRAKYPTLNIPVIVFSILTMISATFSPLMTSNAAFESLVKRILTAMLAAFGLATGVSLFILPVSSRKVTFGQMKGAIMLLRGAMKQEKLYLQSLERDDMFAVPASVSGSLDTREEKEEKSKKQEGPEPNNAAEARALKETVAGIRDLAGKIQTDLPFAKRDFAWGKLDAADLKEIYAFIRACLIPVVGVSTVIDIFQRIAERREWIINELTPPEVVAEKNEEKRIWNEIMKQLHEPCEALSEAMDQGLEHAAIVLEILPTPKKTDEEAKGDLVQPGDARFAAHLEEKMKKWSDTKKRILHVWAKERGLMKGEASQEDFDMAPLNILDIKHQRDQTQLFILLYIEKLIQEAGNAVQRFVAFADAKVESGAMKKNRLIIPKYKMLRKWASSVFRGQSGYAENNADLFDSGNVVYMGDGFAEKKDPEHLPPTNIWQRFGNLIRAVSAFWGSQESLFGFRVACATMTIGIAAFLESTWVFFQTQRLVWAMIIIAIGMTETSGQSIFGFLCRVGGTFIAMILSLVTWYVVDGKIPGVLVFLFLFLVVEYYFFIKFPQFIPAVMICMITHVLVIGYELQVLKIGIAASEATGQAYYPIYELAPYRLATVAGGCLVAFIWTIFPSPMTERTFLRRDLSATLYLLANYHTVINESLKAKFQKTGGDPKLKSSPAHRLAKHRHQLFGKLMLTLPALKQHANFQRWEPSVGGRFPSEIYEEIILRATRISSYLTLVAYTINWSASPSDPEDEVDRSWIEALVTLLENVAPMQHNIIMTLTLLSNSLQSGHSLPPHIPLPRPYELTRQLEAAAYFTNDKRPLGLLDASNMAENGYAEFAVLQVCSSLIADDLAGLVKSVSKLVGVVDFSFRVEESSASVSSGSFVAGASSRRESVEKEKVH